MKRWAMGIVILLLAMAMLIANVFAASDKDTLIFNLDRVIVGGMDASQTMESTGKKAAFHISETLVEFDEEKNIVVPKLAVSWQVSPDGKSITFKLRKGVKFHDGTPFNADAVVFSIMRIYDKNHPYHNTGTFTYASYVPIEKVEKIDEYTVKVTATRPDPILLWRMTMEPTYIQSPTAIKKWGKDYTNHAVGTGPYKLVEFDKDVKIVLERFEDYWGPKPSIKRLVFKINPDDQSKVADLLAGNVDVITRPPADQIPILRATPGIKVDIFPLRWLGYLAINVTRPPLDDVRVRQALSYAFDRKALEEINKGTSLACYYPWFKGAYGFEPNVKQYTYNPDKARKLLEEAGWTLPKGRTIREKKGKALEIRLVQAGALYGPEAAIPELFQSNMRDVGINVKIVRIDPGVFFDPKVGVFNPETADVVVFGMIAFLPDPSFFFDRFTSVAIPPNGFNISFYTDPRVEELWKKAVSEMDLDKRAEMFKEIQRIVAEQVPILYHSVVTLPLAYRDNIEGIRVRGNVTVDLTQVRKK
ncbi:MAG: hypothetical protein HPY71_13225 [Firmicutes bacterium]|nr:hypothetical protein [Bacillota bacterium]